MSEGGCPGRICKQDFSCFNNVHKLPVVPPLVAAFLLEGMLRIAGGMPGQLASWISLDTGLGMADIPSNCAGFDAAGYCFLDIFVPEAGNGMVRHIATPLAHFCRRPSNGLLRLGLKSG